MPTLETMLAEPAADASLAAVRRIVSAQTDPPLLARRVRYLGRGSLNVAYRIDDRAVVRLPVAEHAFTRPGRSLLELLFARGAPVPRPLARGEPGTHFPWPFVVYAFVPGTPLDQARWRSLAPAPRRRLEGALTAFLAVLAELPLARVAATGCPDLTAQDLFGAWVARRLDRLRRTDARHAARLDRRCREDPRLRSRPRGVVHMDFNPGNLLYDAATGGFAAIDVEGIAIGHPVIHFAAFAEHFGIAAARRALTRASERGGEDLRAQLELAHELATATR